MMKRRIYDDELHAQFVTFSCYRRRRLLDHPRARQVVVSFLASELAKLDGICSGFVVMPDHVHAIVWFPAANRLSQFMKQWKQKSSVALKRFVRGHMQEYARTFDTKQPFWQPRYYPFNLYSEKKAKEKLDYMHDNPVRAGLVESACDWPHSSARYWQDGRSVGVPLEWIFWRPLVAPQHGHFSEHVSPAGSADTGKVSVPPGAPLPEKRACHLRNTDTFPNTSHSLAAPIPEKCPCHPACGFPSHCGARSRRAQAGGQVGTPLAWRGGFG